jgi:hypothetical protein
VPPVQEFPRNMAAYVPGAADYQNIHGSSIGRSRPHCQTLRAMPGIATVPKASLGAAGKPRRANQGCCAAYFSGGACRAKSA